MNHSELLDSNSSAQLYVVTVILPIDKCPKVKTRYINDEGKAAVYLTSKTTMKDALEGNNIYALSGVKGLIVNNRNYARIKVEVENYLNERFGKEWRITLKPIK